ncbi:hypothetical protein CIB84_003001 [Bambusicola thoracicus]|uniref:Uncharacterized protein n=1 Tax=Bambusicola thoracicus TaxID=9083 RepID=A0A2P4TA61_BAMTH|nr:hypothetical protein CIB84_003001 [Bambusicola thoracicus]
MVSRLPVASRFSSPDPLFGEVAPEIIEDTLIHLAMENEQHLSVLPDPAGCFREARTVGHNGCLLPAKPLHQMCVQLLDFFYLKRDIIYDTLLNIAIENLTPSELQM